jgi:hypothetical protein
VDRAEGQSHLVSTSATMGVPGVSPQSTPLANPRVFRQQLVFVRTRFAGLATLRCLQSARR